MFILINMEITYFHCSQKQENIPLPTGSKNNLLEKPSDKNLEWQQLVVRCNLYCSGDN